MFCFKRIVQELTFPNRSATSCSCRRRRQQRRLAGGQLADRNNSLMTQLNQHAGKYIFANTTDLLKKYRKSGILVFWSGII